MQQTPYYSYNHAAETCDSATQIIILYNATINYVKQAEAAIKNNDQETRFTLMNKAMSVMRGLRICLDFSASPEIATAMDRYYDALEKLMLEVQCNQDKSLCAAIIENLQTIKNSWEQINLKLSEVTEPDVGSKNLLV